MPLAKVNRTRYGHALGRDGGCFAHALWAVKTFGGVLEHPANTSAWEFFGLRKPARGQWLEAGAEWRWGTGKRFWVCQVAQSAYGHMAIKRTWLFYAGHQAPPPMFWDEPPARAVTSWLQRTNTQLPRLTKNAAKPTPPAFRDALLDLARLNQGTATG
jgi:hypothetical protein